MGMRDSDMVGSKWEQSWVDTNALKRYVVGNTAFPLLLRTERYIQRTQYP